MHSLFRLQAQRVVLSGVLGFWGLTKTEPIKLPKIVPDPASYYLNVCVVKQDIWDHVACQIVVKDEIPLYKSLCQQSHLISSGEDDLDKKTVESDDFSRLLLHWYRTLLRPILVGEPAVFEKDSLPIVTQTFSIPLSKKEYLLALAYIQAMDKTVDEGRIGYAGLDRTRNFMTEAGCFIGALGLRDLAKALEPDAMDAIEIQERVFECVTPSKTVFYNCATYVEKLLDELEIPKAPTRLREAFCTWPSSVAQRAKLASIERGAYLLDS